DVCSSAIVKDARTGICSEFLDIPYLCIFYRYRFGYFSSRGIKGCASRFWTKAGACTIDLSSWREYKAGACTCNYRVSSCSIRTVWSGLVHINCRPGCVFLDLYCQMVRDADDRINKKSVEEKEAIGRSEERRVGKSEEV